MSRRTPYEGLPPLDKSYIFPMVLAMYAFEVRTVPWDSLLTEREMFDFYLAHMGANTQDQP